MEHSIESNRHNSPPAFNDTPHIAHNLFLSLFFIVFGLIALVLGVRVGEGFARPAAGERRAGHVAAADLSAALRGRQVSVAIVVFAGWRRRGRGGHACHRFG